MAECQDCNEQYNIDGYDDHTLEPCDSACSLLEPVGSDCIIYTGIDIPCLGIVSGLDTLKTVFIKLVAGACGNLSTTTTTTAAPVVNTVSLSYSEDGCGVACNLPLPTGAYVAIYNIPTDNFSLALPVTGTFPDSTIFDWGDGSVNYGHAGGHTYTTAGDYMVTIRGEFGNLHYGASPIQGAPYGFPKLRIKKILQWGGMRLTDTGVFGKGIFEGCVNLDLSEVSDVPTIYSTFNWNAIAHLFEGCTSLTTVNRINEWVVSDQYYFDSVFKGCTNFNSDISNWNLYSGFQATSMFEGAASFNQPIGSWLNSPNTMYDMGNMFLGATAFNQDISGWDISNTSNMSGFMSGKTDADYSATYLDNIYNAWSELPVTPGVSIDFGTIKYTAAGAAGKAVLEASPNDWTISDGGI